MIDGLIAQHHHRMAMAYCDLAEYARIRVGLIGISMLWQREALRAEVAAIHALPPGAPGCAILVESARAIAGVWETGTSARRAAMSSTPDRPTIHALTAEQVGELWDTLVAGVVAREDVATKQAHVIDRHYWQGSAMGLQVGLTCFRASITASQAAEDAANIETWTADPTRNSTPCPLCGQPWSTRLYASDTIRCICPAGHEYLVAPQLTAQ